MKKLPKIIVIIGAQPDIGKGIFTASCTYLLQERGFSTNPLKFDGYLNYNSGTINRYHDKVASSYFNEEVFVLKDGFETDVDSGYYERFLNREFDTTSVLTNGMIIKEIIALENKKGYPMGTILKFSDIRKLILRWFMKTAEKSEIIGLEIGGTIGDPESKIVYEALDLIKQTKRANIITLMLAPYLPSRSENNKKYDFSLSSKTIRKSFLLAWKNNLKPDGIIIRCKEKNMNQRDLDYILSDCYLSDKDIFFDYDCKSIYDLPEILTRQHFTEYIINKFNLSTKKNKKTKSIETYSLKLNKLKSNKGRLIKLGIFGKTVSYDSFISLIEAIEHAMVFLGIKVDIIWLDDSKNFKK
jgi:CTP synthase